MTKSHSTGRLLRSSAIALVAFSLASTVSAQDQQEQEAEPTNDAVTEDGQITVTATRTPVLTKDAPATVTVITDEDIADQLATDTRDLVRFEPGVTVRRAPARFGAAGSSLGRGRNEDFVIRGIGGNRVLIQVDGIRTPQGFAFGAQSAGRGDYTDVSLVKSVEILRGPASALYGSDGVAGIVSFTTSDPTDLLGADAFGGFVRAQYSSEDNEFAETIALAAQSGNWSSMVAYTRRDFQELETQGDVGGVGPDRTIANPQDGRSNALLGKLVWDNGEHRLRLTGEALDQKIESNVLSGQRPVFFGPSVLPDGTPLPPAWIVDRLDAEDFIERSRISADWTYTGSGDGALDFAHLAVYYQDTQNSQTAEEDRTAVAFPSAPDRTRINNLDTEVYGLVAEVRKSFSTGPISHRIAFGGDVSVTTQESLRDGTIPPRGETFPTRAFPKTDFTLGGIFLADEIKLFDGVVTLFPALRFDFYDLNPSDDPLLGGLLDAEGQSDSRLSPKVGVTIDVTDTVKLFGNYSQGFLAPTPGQVNNFFTNVASGYASIPNPDLSPETSESFEGGIRFNDDIFSAQLVAFSAEYDNFINQRQIQGEFGNTADPAIFQFVNEDRVEIEGIEGRFGFRLKNGITGNFAFAYADGDVIDIASGASRPLETIDPINIVAGLGYRDPDGRFGADFIVTHNGQKEADEVDDATLCPGPPQPPGFCVRPEESTIFDITAFVNITDALKLRAGLFNVFDETYALWADVRGLRTTGEPFEAFTRPGRNFSASVSFQF
ncbi:MAG: TonB-dependent hemoglobin/transferrin/lactoferrin family receptor [Pseudomonadota bacterium]